MKEWYILGVGKCVLFREVSSFQRLKCMQEWYILGVGKCVLFREVLAILIEREVPLYVVMQNLKYVR